MAVRYVQRRLNGGGRSIKEVEPPPESLEVSKYLSSVQRFIKMRGCRCRSNREMVSNENMQTASTMETGARRRYKAKSLEKSNTGVNGTPSNSTGSEKRKRTPNFDYDNPPKKVTWKLNCFPEAPGSWTPFINGEMVPEHTRKEWDAAFAYHVHGVVASSSKVDEVGVNLEAGA